jgi:hypothetical protein
VNEKIDRVNNLPLSTAAAFYVLAITAPGRRIDRATVGIVTDRQLYAMRMSASECAILLAAAESEIETSVASTSGATPRALGVARPVAREDEDDVDTTFYEDVPKVEMEMKYIPCDGTEPAAIEMRILYDEDSEVELHTLIDRADFITNMRDVIKVLNSPENA